jgi:hypothetical protein
MTPTIRQPSLADLTDRMLAARLSAPTVDAGEHEVEPYEVMNGFRTDSRTAFTESVASLKLLGATNVSTSLPPEWASFVQLAANSPAVPMAAGQFPQKVRDAAALMDADDLTVFAPKSADSVSGFQSLRAWVKKQPTSTVTVGIARALGDAHATTGTDAVAVNERAASAWLAGQHADAIKLWSMLPDSPVASFNLGVALLFTGKADEAVPHLKAAADTLPDNSGWSHLAALYLAVAQSR